MRKLIALLCYLATTATAAPFAITQQNCSWDKPGEDRYTGTVSDAVDYYIDIPAASRVVLKRRIQERQYDDKVDITRDAVEGEKSYTPDIREMHFGTNKVCTHVTRTRWAVTAVQPALVYCEGPYCIIVPFVCGNVSRISLLPLPVVPPPPATPIPPGFYGYPHSPQGAAPPMVSTPLSPPGFYGWPPSSPQSPFPAGSSGSPGSPATPPVTTPPDTTGSPGVPITPVPPGTPDTPGIPNTPSTPDHPTTPDTPGVPVTPIPPDQPLPPVTPPVKPTPIPEPGTIFLTLLGLVGIAAGRRKKSTAR